MSGDDVPMQPGFSYGFMLGTPVINEQGQVLALAVWLDGEGGGAQALIRSQGAASRQGTYDVIATDEQLAPGAGGERFTAFAIDFGDDEMPPWTPGASMNASGDVAFLGGVSPQFTANNFGAWSTPASGGLENLFVRNGTTLPGDPDALALGGFIPRVTDSGDVLFNITARNIPSEAPAEIFGSTIFRLRDGAFEALAGYGREAPGVEGAVFSSRQFGISSYTDEGRLAFDGAFALGTPGVTEENDEGVWAGPSDALRLIAREGDAAPGVGGAVFDAFDDAKIAPTGETVVRADLRGGDASSPTRGVWLAAENATALIAAQGQPAPGTAGTKFEKFGIAGFGDAGQFLLPAELTLGVGGTDDTNNEGVWFASDGALDLVLREGDSAPGLAGRMIGDIDPGAGTPDGLFVILTELQDGANSVVPDDPELPDFDDGALWLYDPVIGEAQAIVASGDLVDVSLAGDGSDKRRVDAIRFHPLTGLANNGLLAYGLRFTDGSSGLFTTTIPTPGALAMLLIGAPLCARRRR